MSRRPRIVVTGVPHHITQRGNNRQMVFCGDEDYSTYLRLLQHQSFQNELALLGYCLMPNHVHLVAVPEHAESLSRTLGITHSQYALELNEAERRTGHLWQNRFFSCPLSVTHLFAAMRYVELNPVRAGLAANAWDWKWSSARAHTDEGAHEFLLDRRWFDGLGGWDYTSWRECLASESDESEIDSLRHATVRGEPLGPPEFIEDLERQCGRRLRVLSRGRPRKEAEDIDAQPMLFGRE